jgi:hypothetical protein
MALYLGVAGACDPPRCKRAGRAPCNATLPPVDASYDQPLTNQLVQDNDCAMQPRPGFFLLLRASFFLLLCCLVRLSCASLVLDVGFTDFLMGILVLPLCSLLLSATSELLRRRPCRLLFPQTRCPKGAPHCMLPKGRPATYSGHGDVAGGLVAVRHAPPGTTLITAVLELVERDVIVVVPRHAVDERGCGSWSSSCGV